MALMYSTIDSGTASQATPRGRHRIRVRHRAVGMLRTMSLDTFVRAVRGKKGREELRANDFKECEVQEDEFDREMRELDARVKKWLKESCPPRTSKVDDDFQLEKKEKIKKISERRRHSVEETQKPSPGFPLGEKSCTELYHPDFADWKAIGIDPTAVSPLGGRNSPIIIDILDGAHTSISKQLRVYNF
jgi:hypothetical protein